MRANGPFDTIGVLPPRVRVTHVQVGLRRSCFPWRSDTENGASGTAWEELAIGLLRPAHLVLRRFFRRDDVVAEIALDVFNPSPMFDTAGFMRVSSASAKTSELSNFPDTA